MSPASWIFLPPPSPSHPSKVVTQPRLSSLSHRANSHWLSILHMVMYVSGYSLHISHPLLPPGPASCVHKSVLYVCLHCCPENRLISTIFLDFMMVWFLIASLFVIIWGCWWAVEDGILSKPFGSLRVNLELPTLQVEVRLAEMCSGIRAPTPRPTTQTTPPTSSLLPSPLLWVSRNFLWTPDCNLHGRQGCNAKFKSCVHILALLLTSQVFKMKTWQALWWL